jgi:tetratricopeptide (TPR) repeat protein
LGDLLLVSGDVRDALRAYETALQLGATVTTTRRKLAKAQQIIASAGDRADDGRPLRKQMAFAEEIRTAEQFEKDGDPRSAEAIYRKVLKTDPDHVEASRLLAGIAAAQEQFQEAEVFLKHAVTIAPDYPRAWVDLANVQRQLEHYDDAIASAARITAMAPDKAESYMVYGSVVGAAGRHDEAIEVYARAIALAPEKAGAMCAMAHHLKTVGRRDEAIAQYRACIAHRSDHCEAYWSLANLKTFRFADAEILAMHDLLDSERLSDESRAQLHNALGLEYEARRDYDKAFENFELCNILKRKAESYDPVDTESTHDRVIELFTEEFLQAEPGDEQQPTPIFVVGLPRSGSTLIEQILASHSQVEGTHELSDLSKVMRGMRQRARREQRFPEIVAHLKSTGWSSIGAEYMARTAKHRSNSACFIDKNPNNFIFAGVLKLAIPNCRIINARRHPLDSCLGTYKQLFASGQPFSYDMTELAEYYLQYQRLMDHWHRVMPGFVLDVQYEDVVGDLESQVRRILEFCNLPFEDTCLRFHETERAVKTASSEQVRRPIYATSVNLWRNYERHLSAMIEIMTPILRELPANSRPSRIP